MNDNTEQLDCEAARDGLEPFFDGQLGDDALRSAIERHLKACEACRNELAVLRILRQQTRALARPEAPPYLRERVTSMIRGTEARRRPWIYRIVPMAGLAAAAALAVFVGVDTFDSPFLAPPTTLASPGTPGGLIAEGQAALEPFVEGFREIVQGGDSRDFQTASVDALEAWYAPQLEFSPKLPKWQWARLVGGRVWDIDGQKIAGVHYEIDGQDVGIYVHKYGMVESMMMEMAEGSREADLFSKDGHRVACWREKDLLYVMVYPESASRIDQMLRTMS